MTHQSFVAKWAVRYQCQQASITASIWGMFVLFTGFILIARGWYVTGGITATLAGGFFGAALQAIRTERRFKD